MKIKSNATPATARLVSDFLPGTVIRSTDEPVGSTLVYLITDAGVVNLNTNQHFTKGGMQARYFAVEAEVILHG